MSRAAALLLSLGWSAPAPAADWLGVWWDPPLTTAESVLKLTPDEAVWRRPVNLAGVVTFARGGKHHLWIQDETAGVRITPTEDVGDLSPGDRVEVDGVTNAAGFSPGVTGRVTKQLQPGEPPKPQPFDLTATAARELDGQWVEARVNLGGAHTEPGVTRVAVCSPGGARGSILVPGEEWAQRAGPLRGAAVVVRGVCVATARGRGMSGAPSIYLAKLPDPPQPGGPDRPPTDIARLREFAPHPHPESRRARITGVVTAAPFPGVLAVQDLTGGATVWARSPEADVAVGTRVEAAGLLRIDDRRVGLALATVKSLGTAPLPEPVAIQPGELAGGFRDGLRVRLTARVDEVRPAADGWTAVSLVEESFRFDAYVPAGDGALAGLEPGSRVEVTGVPLEATPDGRPAAGPGLFLRDAGSLVVVAPPPRPSAPPEPWWTGRRVAYLAGGFLIVSAVGAAWVLALRVQVRRAERAMQRKLEETAQLEAQLRQAAKMEALGRLAGGIAHDFNNVLTVINGSAELLADETAAARPHVGELIEDIRRAGGRAADLTAQLLTFSRKREVPVSAVDLNESVADAIRLLDRVLGENIRIEARLAPNLPPVRGEPGMLNQVIVNLAVNARDAMPNGGTLTLSTSLVSDTDEAGGGPDVPVGTAPREYVRLVVSDTGVGMSEEVKAHAFEPFFTTKEVGKGTGLGLATVYGIVQTLRGRIRLESEIGRGTTFVIDFRPYAAPLSDTTPPAPTEATPPPVGTLRPLPGARLSGVTVLVVEDNEMVRELMVNGLSAEGATVLTAARPDHALRVLADHPDGIDVLVTDVVMPGMSGRQLAERVWAGWPGVRVVFMSGYTAEEVVRQGVHEDQVEFVQKPFTPDEMTARLLRVLGRPA